MDLAGHVLDGGILVLVAPLLVHHRDLYASRDAFVPERFVGRSAPDPATWIPFGGGTRRGLGAELATSEMGIVLSELICAYALGPAGERAERARLTGTAIAPARGASVVLSRRAVAIC